MKSCLLTILAGAFGAMAIAAPALAATSVSFTPVGVNAREGQVFTLTIGVNPQGTKNYTAKTELRYPADLMEVTAFIFANGWMPLSQAGYDLTDNGNGVFIKTAGYPGGVSAPTAFGTVSFLAKKSGKGTIDLNNNSFILDANNQNILAPAPVQTAVAISAGAAPVLTVPITTPKIPKVPTTSTAPASKEEKPAVLEQEMLVAQEQPIVPQPRAPRSLLASIGSFVTFGTDNVILGALVSVAFLILLGCVIYAVIRRTRRRSSEKSRQR